MRFAVSAVGLTISIVSLLIAASGSGGTGWRSPGILIVFLALYGPMQIG